MFKSKFYGLYYYCPRQVAIALLRAIYTNRDDAMMRQVVTIAQFVISDGYRGIEGGKSRTQHAIVELSYKLERYTPLEFM